MSSYDRRCYFFIRCLLFSIKFLVSVTIYIFTGSILLTAFACLVSFIKLYYMTNFMIKRVGSFFCRIDRVSILSAQMGTGPIRLYFLLGFKYILSQMRGVHVWNIACGLWVHVLFRENS